MKLQTLKPRLHVEKPKAEIKKNWGGGRGGRPWRRLRDRILLRDQYTCQHCGLVGMKLEVDHIVNKAQGGTDDPENLQSLCVPCHKKKTSGEAGGYKIL